MKARQAKKLLKNLTIATLKPGDVVLVNLPFNTSESEAERIYRGLGQLFPNNRVAVLPDDVGVRIVRQYPCDIA